MKKLKGIYKELFIVLPKGASNPITVKDISNHLNVTDRTVRHLFNQLIHTYGIPVVSSPTPPYNGVFIATTEEERQIGVATAKKQAITLLKKAEQLNNIPLTNVTERIEELGEPHTVIIRPEQIALF